MCAFAVELFSNLFLLLNFTITKKNVCRRGKNRIYFDHLAIYTAAYDNATIERTDGNGCHFSWTFEDEFR